MNVLFGSRPAGQRRWVACQHHPPSAAGIATPPKSSALCLLPRPLTCSLECRPRRRKGAHAQDDGFPAQEDPGKTASSTRRSEPGQEGGEANATDEEGGLTASRRRHTLEPLGSRARTRVARVRAAPPHRRIADRSFNRLSAAVQQGSRGARAQAARPGTRPALRPSPARGPRSVRARGGAHRRGGSGGEHT